MYCRDKCFAIDIIDYKLNGELVWSHESYGLFSVSFKIGAYLKDSLFFELKLLFNFDVHKIQA